jgi:hypothetical protein
MRRVSCWGHVTKFFTKKPYPSTLIHTLKPLISWLQIRRGILIRSSLRGGYRPSGFELQCGPAIRTGLPCLAHPSDRTRLSSHHPSRIRLPCVVHLSERTLLWGPPLVIEPSCVGKDSPVWTTPRDQTLLCCSSFRKDFPAWTIPRDWTLLCSPPLKRDSPVWTTPRD